VVEVNRIPVMVCAIKRFIEASGTRRHGDNLATFGFICVRHLILDENSFIWTFWYACPAIDASVWVNVKPGPLFNRFTWDNAFHRADIDTSGIAQAKARYNVCHRRYLPIFELF
jgi:hypothetical protein